MNIKSVFITLLPLAALPLAHANPIDITTCGGANVTAAPQSDFGNFGDNTVYNWLTGDICSYNSLCGNPLSGQPNLTCETGLQQGNGCDSITLDVTGCDYVFLNWGGQKGGWTQAYYVGDCSGNYTFCNSDIGSHSDDCGLSFYCCYQNCVPDGGSTGLMFGAALGGLGVLVMIRRFKS